MIVRKYCDAEENAHNGFSPNGIRTILEQATRQKLADEHWVVVKLHDILADFYLQTKQHLRARAHFEKVEHAWNIWHSKRFNFQRAYKRMRFSGLLAKCKDFCAAVKFGSLALAEMRAILPRAFGCVDMCANGMVDPSGSMERELREHLNCTS